MHTLLAGCGDLNTAVGMRLHAAGFEVTGVRRSPEQQNLPFPVISRDLTATDQDLPQSDAVVVSLTASSRDAAGYRRAYRDTMTGLARALPAPPQRLIFVSSTSVLGELEGHTVTEATTPQPTRDTARELLAAESELSALFPHTQVTVLRPAGIYGPGRHRTIDRVRAGTAADHSKLTNRIHRDDLVSIITTLHQHPDPPNLLHAVDQAPVPLGEVLAFIASALGVPTPPDSGDGTVHGKRLDGAAAHHLLRSAGQDLAYPSYAEGYRELISLY